MATPGTPFKAVERLEDLGRPQAALAVLQARQGSSGGALPASQGLEAARVGVRLLLRCGLLPEAYAEVGQAACWQLHLGKVWTIRNQGTFSLQVSMCLSPLTPCKPGGMVNRRLGYTLAEAAALGFSGAAARQAECSVGWPVQGKLIVLQT